MNICFGINVNNSEIELEMLEAQSAGIMYQNELDRHIHILNSNMYSEALGSLIAFGGVLKAAFFLISKFILSFKGIILTVITGFLAFIAKRKLNGKNIDSYGGGGGGSFSASTAPITGRPGISANGIASAIQKVNSDREKHRKNKVDEMMSNGKLSRATFDKTTAKILSEIIPQSMQEDLTKDVLVNIGKDLKEQDINKLLRLGVDQNNFGAMIFGDGFLAGLVRDIVKESFADGKTSRGKSYQDAINQAGPLEFLDRDFLFEKFDDVAKALDLQHNKTDNFVNLVAEWLSEYTNIFGATIALQTMALTFGYEFGVSDEEISEIKNKTDNKKVDEIIKKYPNIYKMVETSGEKVAETASVAIKTSNAKSAEEVVNAVENIVFGSFGKNYQIEKPEDFKGFAKSIDEITNKAFIQIKDASQLTLEVENLREDRDVYLVDFKIGPDKEFDKYTKTKFFAIRFINELNRLKGEGSLELSDIKSSCDDLSKSAKVIADTIDKNTVIPQKVRPLLLGLTDASQTLNKALMNMTTCAIKFSKMSNHPIYKLIEEETSDVANTIIAMGIVNYAESKE